MIDLASKIPLRAKKILELGCGRGETGKIFRTRQPKADYWGVTQHEDEALAASACLSRALTMLPGELTVQSLRKAGLFAPLDVLLIHGEYFKALRREELAALAGLLTARGQLLCLLDNGGYLPHLLSALEGKPTAEGIFPAEQAAEKMRTAGLEVYHILSLHPDGETEKNHLALAKSEEMQGFIDALSKLFQKTGRQVRVELLASHYLLRCGREKPEHPRLSVHAMEGEALVTARVRVEEPLKALAAEPLVESHWEEKALNPALDGNAEAKICLKQRLSYHDLKETKEQLEWLRQRGYLVVHELDDNPELWRDAHEKNGWADFRCAHGVQVSTKPLAEILRQYNPEVAIFRNELQELPERRNYTLEVLQRLKDEKTDYVTIFFGALNREKDWQEIMGPLNEAAKRYGSKLRFKVLADKPFFAALKTKHKEFIGRNDYYGGKYVPYEVYVHTLRSADISLLPLHDTSFNRTKSDLKFIESAGHGAAVLASPTVYQETVKDGRTGFIYRDARDFAEKLRLLVEDKARRLDMAGAAYEYVRRERLLCQHYQERLDWYLSLWERRQELDNDMMTRLQYLETAAGKKE